MSGVASRALPLLAVALLIATLAARLTTPSEICDYAQHRTMSYTTDIIVHGHWVLPREQGTIGATKPPLYNWLAVPAVRIAGFANVTAHKSPSLLAVVACVALLVVIGNRIGRDGALGWIAALAFCTNHAIFKLAWLARPDMLLVLWISVGWVAATAVLAGVEARGRWRLVFWIAVALAMLTKGPPTLLLLLYGLLGGRVVSGRWSDTRRLGWGWGLPLALVAPALWIAGVALVDRGHLWDRLVLTEVLGRVTGTGPEGGAGQGPGLILRQIGYVPAYFLTRFAPWSLPAILAMIEIFRRRGAPPETDPTQRPWLRGATLLVVVTLLFFTVSAGKRADYIAPCLVPASMLAAWGITRMRPRRLAYPVTITAAAVTLVALAVAFHREIGRDRPGCGDAAVAFAHRVTQTISRDPGPLVFWETGGDPLQALLGVSRPEGWPTIEPRLMEGGHVWLVGGRRPVPPMTFVADWVRDTTPGPTFPFIVTEMDRAVAREGDWGFAYLYRIDPWSPESR